MTKAFSWSDWKDIAESCGHWNAAIYEIRLMTKGKPSLIRRWLGDDAGGLLTIGQTKNMESRRNNFIRGMTKCEKHSAGNLLYFILAHSRMRSIVPMHGIQYRFLKMRTAADAKLLEALNVKQYIIKFGEPPPLNSAIPDRYGEWTSVGAKA